MVPGSTMRWRRHFLKGWFCHEGWARRFPAGVRHSAVRGVAGPAGLLLKVAVLKWL